MGEYTRIENGFSRHIMQTTFYIGERKKRLKELWYLAYSNLL